MLNSMTAFGRATTVNSLGRFMAQIQSVNRRFLEISISLPRELAHFEMDVRRWVSEKIHRGQIHLRIEATFEKANPMLAVVDLALAQQTKLAWRELCDSLKMKVDEQSLLEFLLKAEIIRFEADLSNQEIHKRALEKVVDEALQRLLHSKQQEGNLLCQEILMRADLIEQILKQIELQASSRVDLYRQKLLKKIQEMAPELQDHEERLLREVCIYADRCDYTEELVRCKSHLKQFIETVSSGKNAGKTLDFLTQELNREVNTIGSKALDSKITYSVVSLKAELERIREQLQNVE